MGEERQRCRAKLLPGVGGGAGCIGGTSRFHLPVEWRQGVGEGSPYAILRCICHKEAFYVRQTLKYLAVKIIWWG